jgi:hypothetical protein
MVRPTIVNCWYASNGSVGRGKVRLWLKCVLGQSRSHLARSVLYTFVC